MDSIAHAAGPLVLAALIMWFVLGPLLRVAATACFITAAAGLAVGDLTAATGIAAFGAGCALAGHLLFRLRHGRWRTARAQRIAARARPTPPYHQQQRTPA